MIEKFIVKHYSEDSRPTIKGNGFDGLELGEDREEAQEFIDFINQELSKKDAEIARLNDALECSEDVEILKSENAHLKDERLSILREIEEDAICYYDVLEILEKYKGEEQ